MMILALELENVKSYEQATIEFTPGVNAIVGHNGAGKSTIVEAIGSTLFNALSYNQSDFVRAGAKTASMTVAFLSGTDERRYEVTRRMGSTSQIFVTDPELQTRICEGRADVDRFLYEHMRLEPGTDLRALYNDAVGVPQGTLTAAFLYSETNRRPIFDRLLQLEDYKTASDKLREPARLLRERRGALETQIAGAAGRLERLDVLLTDVAQDKAALEKLEASRVKLERELAAATERRAALEAAQSAAQAAQQALTQAEQRMVTLGQQETSAAAALADAETAHATVAANLEGYTAYTEAQSAQTELDRRVEARRQLTDQLTQVDKQLALQQAALARAQEELAEIDAAASTVAALQGKVAEQEELEGRIVQAQREAARLEDAEKQVQQYEAARTRLHKQRAELEKNLADSARLETQHAENAGKVERLRAEVDEKRAELAGLKTQADALKKQTQELGQEFALCPVCEQPLADTQRRALLERNAADLERMRQAYAATQAALKAQDAEAAELRQAGERIATQLRRAPRTEELARLDDDLAHTQRMLHDAQTTVEALRGAGDTIARLQRQVAELDNPKQQHAVAAARAAQHATVEARRHAAAGQLVASQSSAAELRTALGEFGDLDARLAQVRGALQSHLEAYQAVLSHRALADQVEARRSALGDLQSQAKVAQTQLEAAAKTAADAAAQFDAQAYAAAREEEQALRTQLGVQESEARYTRERLVRQEAEVATLQELARDMAQMQARQGELHQQEKALEKIRTLLRQAQPYIARALVRRISESAEQIFGDIMQDYSRYLQWGEDYGITLRVDDHERQFAQLSGGEQMSAALAVRLALLREMSNIEVAFFDEPTANLDETRRESLARQILQVRGFRQLFVISHDDTFEQATQNVIRVERVNGSSRVYAG